MLLSEIIKGVELVSRSGDQDPRIGKITFDSRTVDDGDLFVAIRGVQTDGHQYMDRAIQSGAAAVVYQDSAHSSVSGVPLMQVSDSRKALALMAAAFYGHPSRELALVGVTGTNGKTTIATLLHQMHSSDGFPRRTPLHHPGNDRGGHASGHPYHSRSLQINALLQKDGGRRIASIVSWKSLPMPSTRRRIVGLEFNGGIFTNLSRDHLDYHKDFRRVSDSEKTFFRPLAGRGICPGQPGR